MEQGRKKLEGVLSAVTYQSILGELNKDCYSHSDFLDLSQQLGLTEFYQELTGRDVGFINCSELLLQRWATVYPEDVSKENLSRIFKETLSLKNIALLLDYEGSELIANSWIKIHTSKLNLESGGRKNPIQKSRLSACLDHEEVVRDVLGPPQYQQIMVASDKDILDHLAILEIARQLDSTGVVGGMLRRNRSLNSYRGGRHECRTLLCGLWAVRGNTFRLNSLIAALESDNVCLNSLALSLKQCPEPSTKLLSTSAIFSEPQAHKLNITANEKNSTCLIHTNLANGRESAEDLLKDKDDGYYLVRPSSKPESYAISLKMDNTVKHFLVQSMMTEEGEQWTLNIKLYPSLEALLSNYHLEEICGRFKLENIILPPQTENTSEIKKKPVTLSGGAINPVYIDKFCELIESHKNKSLDQDVAERLGYGQLFKNYKCGLDGKYSSRSKDARWILEKWIVREGERASVDYLEKTLNGIKDLQKMLKKLKAFSKPW